MYADVLDEDPGPNLTWPGAPAAPRAALSGFRDLGASAPHTCNTGTSSTDRARVCNVPPELCGWPCERPPPAGESVTGKRPSGNTSETPPDTTHLGPHWTTCIPAPRPSAVYSSLPAAPGVGADPKPPSAAAGACGCRRGCDHRRRSGGTVRSAVPAPLVQMWELRRDVRWILRNCNRSFLYAPGGGARPEALGCTQPPAGSTTNSPAAARSVLRLSVLKCSKSSTFPSAVYPEKMVRLLYRCAGKSTRNS